MAPRLHSAALVALVVVVTVCSMDVAHADAGEKDKCNGRKGLSKCPSYPNAITTCEDGLCSATCQPGYGNCNGNMTSDGCETFIAGVDGSNCGGCGTECKEDQFPSSKARCTNGVCGNLLCNTGYTDCNGKLEDGCEVYTDNDIGNCGLCGNVCPEFPKTVPRCFQGACSSDCQDDFTQCYPGIIDSRGCTDLVLDKKNCGQCGTVCGPDDYCYLSECTLVP